jgi:raffinose/stachyose/melibiose transport system permease protein
VIKGLGPDGAVRRHRQGPSPRRSVWPLFFVASIGLTGLFLVYPLFESVRLAVTGPVAGGEAFVGLDQFARLADDRVARGAIINTLVFALGTALGTVAIGTAIAIAIDRKIRLAGVFKFLIFLPVVLPAVFMGLVWANGLDPNFGWVGRIVGQIHPSLNHPWLADPQTALLSVMAMTVLQYAGFAMIIVLGALQDVPADLHEAATLDGASATDRAIYVTLPLVRDVVVIVFLLQFINGAKVFDQVFVMTQGGPGTSSEVMSTFVYRMAFRLQEFHYAAAGAVATSVLIVVLALAYLAVFRSRQVSRAG